MAKYADPVIKQIVDDINTYNTLSLPRALTVEEVTIGNPRINSLEGNPFTNTLVDLLITTEDDFAGTYEVNYRRLDPNVCYSRNTTQLFPGQSGTTITRGQLITAVERTISFGLIDELVDNNTAELIDITDNVQYYTFAIKPDSLKFVGDLVVSLQAVKFNLSSVNSAYVQPYTNEYPESLLPLLNVEAFNPQQRVLDQVWEYGKIALGNPNLPAISSQGIEFSNIVFDNNQYVTATITALPSNDVWAGSANIRWDVLGFSNFFANITGSYPYSVVHDGTTWTTLGQWIEYFCAEKNIVNIAQWLVDGPRLPPSRENTWVQGKLVEEFPVFSKSFNNVQFTNTQLYPLECEFTFNVPVANSGMVLYTYDTAASQRVAVTVEIISKPAAFTPTSFTLYKRNESTWAISDTLPVGDYRVRVTAPDSYRTTGTFDAYVRFGTNVNWPSVRISRLHKLRSWQINRMFSTYRTEDRTLRFIDPGALSQAWYLSDSKNAFENCIELQEIPSDLFDGCPFVGGLNIARLFRNCSSITAIPDGLFTNKQPLTLQFTLGGVSDLDSNGPFAGTSVTELSANIVIGVGKHPVMPEFFGGLKLVESVPENLLENFKEPNYYTDYTELNFLSGLFSHSGVKTVPENLLAGLFDNAYQQQNFSFEWMFAMGALESIPENFFQSARTSAQKSNKCKFGYLLASCPIQTVPENLFAGLFVGEGTDSDWGASDAFWGLFYNCANLTTVPANLLKTTVGMPSGNFNRFFAGTAISSVPTGFFADLDRPTSYTELFANCPNLKSVDADVLGFHESVRTYDGIFAGSALETIPPTLFATAVKATTFEGAFRGCTGITSVPGSLFQASVLTTSFKDTFNGATNLASVGSGLFNGLSAVTTFEATFKGTTALQTIPANLFVSATTARVFNEAFMNSGLTAIPANLFPTLAADASTNIYRMFMGTAITSVPNDVFYPLRFISNGSELFANCPNLTTIGRLFDYRGTTASQYNNLGALTTGNIDYALADNLIIFPDEQGFMFQTYSSLGNSLFANNAVLTKNITNLFSGKFTPSGFTMQGYKVTGSGNDFLTKHDITSPAGNRFFTGVTTLSDYATLPSWATMA